MNNPYNIAMLYLDGLIAGVEANSEILVHLSELQLLKQLLQASTNKAYKHTQAKGTHIVKKSELQPSLRAVVSPLFPTMDSPQSVMDMAVSQLPITTPNVITNILMTFQNTLLQDIKE